MLLDGFTAEEDRELHEVARVRTFAAGEALIREGTPGRSLFLIRSGIVEVVKDLKDTIYRHLKDFGPGEMIGELGFLGLPTRTASVVAKEDCEAIEISAEVFAGLASRRPDIGMKVYRNIAIELADRLGKNTEELRRALLVILNQMEV